MPDPKDIYIKCDELDKLPLANKDNWLFEIELLKKELPVGAAVLQVGCMDGTRIIKILEVRPDLIITGLEIEKNLVGLARDNLAKAGLSAKIIPGDITKPPALPSFDYIICLLKSCVNKRFD